MEAARFNVPQSRAFRARYSGAAGEVFLESPTHSVRLTDADEWRATLAACCHALSLPVPGAPDPLAEALCEAAGALPVPDLDESCFRPEYRALAEAIRAYRKAHPKDHTP